MKKAFITGVTGQLGSYVAELLLSKGMEVHGLIRRSSQFNTQRIEHLYQEPWEENCRFFLHHADITDAHRLRELIEKIQPDEIYHLAAQSHVKVSFEGPVYSVNTIVQGTLNLLEACRDSGRAVRIFHSASSEMFGSSPPPQNEETPFHPRSPYACAKCCAFWQCVNYREAYGMFVCNGIMFNMESPRRGETFVTRKITRAATRIKLGLQKDLRLGNLDAIRDWGFAGDYAQAMWLMLQKSQPDDYVIATGKTCSVFHFCEMVFEKLGMQMTPDVVKYDERLLRPAEVDYLCGDANKARLLLEWKPKTSFKQLLDMMIESDMKLARQELLLKENGHA